ncbi:MAG TPA: hypothetical protein VNT22_05400, partial [Baekduia sp.]|nr:hypothetical protein [Baekduia sp.]
GCIPDGEVGPRRGWTGMIAELVLANHPDVEETLAPALPGAKAPEHETEQAPVEDLEGIWNFRVKPGRAIRFDDLKYGDFATSSYEVFKRLTDEGVIPEDVRFQVSIPAPHSAIDGWFEDPAQWPELHRAYVDGIRREIDKMLATIPAEKLAIQWDMAWEFIDIAMGERNYLAYWPKLTGEQKFQRHAEQFDELGDGIPEETWLGFHWCYGTWGGWPMTAMLDLEACVRMSNEAVRRVPRRVDWVHMPVVRQPDDAFFAPLGSLDIGDTTAFLGLVHHDDTIEDFRRRRDLARGYLSSFGIASVCGYGRLDPGLLPEALRVHAEDAEEL